MGRTPKIFDSCRADLFRKDEICFHFQLFLNNELAHVVEVIPRGGGGGGGGGHEYVSYHNQHHVCSCPPNTGNQDISTHTSSVYTSAFCGNVSAPRSAWLDDNTPSILYS